MRIDALQYRTEDKQDIIIVVDFYEDYRKPVWRVVEIKYKTSRQREYRYFTYTFRDNWEYRSLDLDERKEYVMKKFEEFVGRDKLNEAVMAAWQMLKPDFDNITVGNI